MARANPGRVAAARALVEVERGGHVEDALEQLAPASGRDRALAWFLALGVLRRRGHVDASLRPHLHQPLAELDVEVRAVLRVGAFEQLFADTPPHAAVSQAVEVARSLGVGRARGLVNAVVRRVRMPRELSDADALDHPAWLVARWTERYGEEAAVHWCRSNNSNPPLFATLRDSDLVADLQRVGLEISPVVVRGEAVERVVRIGGLRGPVTELPGFAEGRLLVQDAAAAAVADLVGEVDGARVLDACAAPGGKAFRLAWRGARVTAVDRSEERLVRLRQSAARLELDVSPAVHDWTEGAHPDLGRFDAVLVDAPCTGLGTVRRHPGIRWKRQLVDVLAMPSTQKAILRATAEHLSPGGALVYAVCSPEPEEGEGVVAAFVASHPGWQVERTLCTAPPEHGEDAFWAARLRCPA